MHDAAPSKAKADLARRNEKLIRASYFLGAVLFHLILFLLVATIVVWKTPAPPPDSEFHRLSVKVPPPPPPPLPTSSGSAADNFHMEPDQVVVPAVTPPSIIAAQHSTFTVDTVNAADEALSHFARKLATGSGMGNAGADGLSGIGSAYGSSSSNGEGLVGTFYDLKQTPDGKPTNMAENDAETKSEIDPNWLTGSGKALEVALLRDFVKSWNEDLLRDYYQAPGHLVASQICILQKPSSDAPKAFNVGTTVRGRRWIIVYHAKVVPPQRGKYRFIGFGDDFLVVRIDGHNVLDGSYPDLGEAVDPAADTPEEVGGTIGYVKYHCGKWFDLQEETAVDMQVLIGEGPGGSSGFILMVQQQGDNSPVGDYPVFQLQDAPIPDSKALVPPSRKKMLFKLSL